MNELLSVLPLIIVLVVFYTILWVPQRRRNKKHTEMLKELKIGNNVITDSGIHGRIVAVDMFKNYHLSLGSTCKVEFQ